jgi:hypothetical protein
MGWFTILLTICCLTSIMPCKLKKLRFSHLGTQNTDRHWTVADILRVQLINVGTEFVHHIDSEFGGRRCLIRNFTVVQLDAEQTGHKVIGVVGLSELFHRELTENRETVILRKLPRVCVMFVHPNIVGRLYNSGAKCLIPHIARYDLQFTNRINAKVCIRSAFIFLHNCSSDVLWTEQKNTLIN